MANALIAFQNRTDGGTLSSGSWQASLPLTNLQSRVLGKVARSTDAALASTKFDIDITADKVVRVVALVNHNFSLSAQFRIRGASDAGFTTVLYDSGWTVVWPSVYSSTTLTWQSLNWWSGAYLTDEITGFTWSLICTLSSAITARYWRVEINDTSNSAGYVQIGRLFMADGWQPVINASYGASIAWETDTDVQKARSGAEYFDVRTPFRVARFATEWMGVDEAYGNAFEIQRRVGIDAEVLFQYDPSDTLHAIRRQFLGRLRQLSPIEQPMAGNVAGGTGIHKTAWEIKELI